LGFDEYTAKLPSFVSRIAFTVPPPLMVSELAEIPPCITVTPLPPLIVSAALGAMTAPFM
jgi:hypothetical protein